MKCSSAFISALECGKKHLPRYYLKRMVDSLELCEIDVERLRRAMVHTEMRIELWHLSDVERDLVIAFVDGLRRKRPIRATEKQET